MVHAVAGKSTFPIKHVLESMHVCFVTSYKRVADNSGSGEWSLNMQSLRTVEHAPRMPLRCRLYFIFHMERDETQNQLYADLHRARLLPE